MCKKEFKKVADRLLSLHLRNNDKYPTVLKLAVGNRKPPLSQFANFIKITRVIDTFN